MSRKVVALVATLLLLMFVGAAFVFAATTVPDSASGATQTRMNNWFQQDQRWALYSMVNDVEDYADDLLTDGNDMTVGVLTVNGLSNLKGAVSSATGALTVTDNVLVDGQADTNQIVVQGYTTQTSSLLVLEQSDGTDKFTVSNAGNVVVAGTGSFAGNLTVSADATGGNAGAKNEVIGLPRITILATGAGTDGTAAGKTLVMMDDTPDGEWVSNSANSTVTADDTYYKAGTKSLKTVLTTSATAGDGVSDTVTYDFSADESVGFWLRSSVTLSAGDLVFFMTDDGGNQTVNVPAIATADVWTWVECDISGVADGDKDVITVVTVQLSSAGATAIASTGLTFYIDAMHKWDATEEEGLGVAVVLDGVLSVVSVVTAQDQANTQSIEVEYTDYFVNYTAANDDVVWISDQSANSNVVLVAYE